MNRLFKPRRAFVSVRDHSDSRQDKKKGIKTQVKFGQENMVHFQNIRNSEAILVISIFC
jgi:hypothetical protein